MGFLLVQVKFKEEVQFSSVHKILVQFVSSNQQKQKPLNKNKVCRTYNVSQSVQSSPVL